MSSNLLIIATGLLDDLESLALARRIENVDSANIDFAIDNLLIVCRHLEADGCEPVEVKPTPDIDWDSVPVADPIPKKREPIPISIAPAPPVPPPQSKRLVARRR